jgi:hypothetical protein
LLEINQVLDPTSRSPSSLAVGSTVEEFGFLVVEEDREEVGIGSRLRNKMGKMG